MNQMDAIISPQIPPTEGGGVKKDAPPPQSQPENGEEQKTQIVSCKSDLQQPSIDTKKEVTSTEMTSIVNGDIQSVETEDQFYDCLTESGENTLPEIPSNNESLSLSSVKEKPTSLSSKATEASTEQVSENFTAKPASTDDTAFGLPASSDVKNTALSNSANKKTANEKTPEKPTAIEKTTSPQASSIEETSTLPASTNEKTTPLPETTTEIISATPQDSNDEKTTSPLDSTNEMTTPPPVSTNEKNTTPSESANKRTTTEKTTLPPASPSVITTHEKPTNIEMNTTPRASTNETTSTLPASTKEKTTLPASTTETIPVSLGSNDDNNKPPPASTNEKTTTPQASNNETTSTSPASTKGKTTKGKERKGRDMRPTLPASTPETISASLGSRDDSNKPPPASTDEETTSPLDSTNEKTTTLQASNNETTSTLPASTKGKERKGRDLRPALPASTTETISASLGSRDDKNKTPPASTDDETTSPLDSTNEKTTTLPASTTETISASLGPRDDQNKSPPTSTNEKNTTPPESANTRTAIERTTTPLASTNETTPILPASTKEKTTPLPASTTETVSASLGSRDDKNKPPPASTNEVICSLPVSTNAKTTPPSDSADKKTTEQKDAYLLASTDENIAHSPASTNETISALLGPASEKTTPSTASANEKAMPLPALTIETTSTESNSTSLGSGDDKTTPPSVVTNKIPPASTDEKTTSSLDSASRKTKNEVIIPPPAPNNEKTNETTTTPSASTKEKTTPAKSPAKENAAPPLSSTSPLVSNDITSKNERTTPLPVPSSIPITSSNGESITPLSSSKEKTLSPQDYESGKTTSSPEPINKKPLVSEVSAKAKIAASKSTDPSTRKKEFILKPLNLPQIPIAPGSSFQSRDSPSSWLDVDHQRPKKKKLLIPEPNLSSSVSETNLLNVSGEFDPDDFITNVKRLAMPFNLPQRKHNKHRLQAPPFAMPAIKEDRFEKPFDPEEFQYGLRRRREFIFDLAPNAISKSQDTEVKEVDIKPKRESILTRSLIFQRARKESEKEEKEEGSDENTTEPPKAKSRLERCSIVSMLRSPSKGRRMEFLSPTESPSDGPLSPSDGSGSTAPALSQLAPTTKPPKLISVEETLAKNDSHSAQSGSQVILKPSRDIGPAMTPDLKTTSKDTTIAMFTDTNTPFLPSGTQTSSQVVLKPTKDDEPTLVPDLKTTSLDPSVTMLTDKNAALKPTYTQSSSQNVLKLIKDDGPAMTPDLRATSRDPTVTLLTDTNAPLDGSQTSSKVVPKPTKDDEPTLVPDLKTTSLDPSVTMLTDKNAALKPTYTQSSSQNVLKPIKDDGPAMTPDLRATSRDPTVTLLTETNAPLDGSQTSSKVVPKPTKDDEPTQAPDLKATSADPSVTLLTDTNTSSPSSGSQVVLKPIKDDGPPMTPDLKATSMDTTVTLLTDTNAPSPPNGSRTSSKVVPKPTKDDRLSQAPDLKATSADPPVTVLTDTNAPPPASSGSQNVLKPIETGTTDLKANSRDPTVTLLTDTNTPSPANGSQTFQVVLKDDGPTLTPVLKTTSLDPPVTMLTDSAPPPPSSGSQNVVKPIKDDGPAITPDPKTNSRDPTVTMFTDTKPPPLLNDTQTDSGVVLQPDGPTLKPTTVDPVVTKITDANAPPSLPSFDGIKLPSFLEKFLPKEPENTQLPKKIDPLVARESASVPGLVDLNKAVDAAAGKIPEVTIPPAPVVPAAQIPQAKPQRELPNIPAARGIHRRPAKIVIFEHPQFSGQSFEFYRDQPDATHMQLSSVVSIKVVRGCWILYEKPGFQGRCIALEEERVTDLPNEWAEEGEETSAPVVIGSVRLAVRDYTPPRIELFTEPTGMGRSFEYVDDTEEVGSYSRPQNTGSIKVHSGLWLVYSDPGFQGLLAVLEAGEYPFPQDWGFPVPMVGSLRPLRMGAMKVENPNAVKAVLYEKAGLQGRCVEVQGDVFSFTTTETDPSDSDNHGLNCVESLKILGGLWVGYDREGFDGQQFVLEEGEYLDWTDWGGTGEKLLSLRPVFMDFSSPHMKMFSEPDFSERGASIDLVEPLYNVADTRYGLHTRSIEVLAGVWVAFEGAGFSGQQYVLEKGLYGSPEDWGASHSRICSAVPVVLENLENSCHFQIELFSESGFGGTSVLVQDALPTMPSGFSVRSCRVHAGSWLAFSGECFSAHQCVLEEGFYSDLRTMGFTQPDVSVLSLQPTGFELSVPSVVLFERSGLRGRRTVLTTSSVNLQMTHSCSRVSSVLVLGGMWVLYEDHNFRGSQFLLKPGAIPDWPKLSSWLRIGSLRPLMQKQVHFRLRNNEAGLLMSVAGSLEDIKLMRIQVSEETGGAEQIWTYQDGLLQCKCLLDVCVDVSSGVLMSGSRAVLSAEPGKPQQLWNITTDGIIRSNAKPDLVLEVKGGQQFDKHQIIVNEFHPDKLNQRWSLEIL
ncbi:beta/gamma crystallin domain-containing protein 1 isoform X1 [Labeo rohita]|nr:beta/gamma crystallin domain-containing protein 1 isoform X1 [Labeo rohita]